MTFREYYIEQFKDVAFVWKATRKNKNRIRILFYAILLLFNPPVVYTMYLCETGRIEGDKRYAEKYVKDCRQADKDFAENRIKENKNE